MKAADIMDITIALGSATPIYRQIVDQVCRAVADGDLVPGDSLPSVRALAERLVVNPNTVVRAYNELQREGLVNAQRGRGLFVAARRPVLAPEERARRLARALETFLQEARLLNLTREEVWSALAEHLPPRQEAREAQDGK